ncbi:MAG: hypothetical protein HFF49_01285 [Lawsonibacter sp.]|jgi:hypothetical protein|nr:hypothetical protein [Lawsonibacter sp.]
MRRTLYFAAGLLVGATVFGGSVAYAAGITAERNTQLVYIDGAPVQLDAYIIGGSNYVKLRDIGQAAGFNVYWDGAVYIDTASPYTGQAPSDQTSASAPTATAQAKPDGSGTFSTTPFTAKALTGDDRAREDFSRQANPAIFTDTLTRAAYNAARQSIVDRDAILAGNNADGFNPCYAYAYTTATTETRSEMNHVLSAIGSYYWYSTTAEPYLQYYYNYPDYFIVKPEVSETTIAAEIYAAPILQQAAALASDAEKVRLFNDFLCDRMTFDRKASASMTDIFNEDGPVVKGKCTTFAYALQYLCDRAGIPCLNVSSHGHAWNVVYADGRWLHVDVSLNTQTRGRAALLLSPDSRGEVNAYPEITRFAQELLVPGSTK